MKRNRSTNTRSPRKKPAATAKANGVAAPAVHSDELWGGPRWIEHAGPEPVYVRTKQEYWDLLNRTGHRMKGQQESTTGPTRDPHDIQTFTPPPPAAHLEPLSYDEATLFFASGAVWRNLGLREALSCEVCFALGRHPGMRVIVGSNSVMVQCRCGLRNYVGPRGTTDLPNRLANTARVLGDRSTGLLYDANNQPVRVATIRLLPEETKIVQQYQRVLSSRRWELRLFCAACWTGRTTAGHEAQTSITAERVIITCHCRVRIS